MRDSSHSCEFQRDWFRLCQDRGEGVGLCLRGEGQGVRVGQDHPGGAVVSRYQRKEEVVENRHQEGKVIQFLKGGREWSRRTRTLCPYGLPLSSGCPCASSTS